MSEMQSITLYRPVGQKDLEKLHSAICAQPCRLLFVTIIGSQLHGFSSSESDYDIRGVHVPESVEGRWLRPRMQEFYTRSDGESRLGGWDATNITTRKKIRIKSAQRLHRQTRGPDQPKEASVGPPQAAELAPDSRKAPESAPGTTAPEMSATGEPHRNEPDKVKRLSGLDAAAKVLAEAKQPLTAKVIVEQMLAKDLWQTNGKTPTATIYAAMIREIAAKGDQARFRKIERGKFELAK